MKSEVTCRRCGESKYVKNGHTRGKQRYLCQECGCNFTVGEDGRSKRGKPPTMKALAVLFYGMGNMTYGMLAKALKVSDVTIYRWVREFGESLPEPKVDEASDLLIVDEMWHFVDGKKTLYGCGEPIVLKRTELWPGCWVSVMMQPAPNSWKKLALKAKPSSPTTSAPTTA